MKFTKLMDRIPSEGETILLIHTSMSMGRLGIRIQEAEARYVRETYEDENGDILDNIRVMAGPKELTENSLYVTEEDYKQLVKEANNEWNRKKERLKAAAQERARKAEEAAGISSQTAGST